MHKHILIVDDEELFRTICREMLEERGYRVSVAADAEEGLVVIGNDTVDLAVVDITLPGMDGLSMIEKAHGVHPDLPAIVITGYLTTDNMLRSLNLGVRGFLTKPFFYDELFQSVERALTRSKAERSQLLVNHYLPMIHLGEEILSADHDEVFSKTLATALHIALRQTYATRGFIVISEPSRHTRLQLATSMGFSPEEQPQLMASVEQVAEVLSGDARDVSHAELGPGMAALVVRIPASPGAPGALVLERPVSGGEFGEDEYQLAHLLATQVAIAIHHHNASQNAHQNAPRPTQETDHTLCDLAASLLRTESRHPDGATLARLADLAGDVAKRMGSSSASIRAVRMAVMFHNLGKAFLPPSLLEKSAPPTAEEWVTLRTYVTLGAERLARVPGLRAASPLVGAQRERWDGRGYPQALAGDAIPRGAQIVAAVTAWGAMSCDRPYRPALSTAEAVHVLRQEVGSAFNPDVVTALLEALGGQG
ncbi:MAG: response regulator [Nitrospirota bacterium]|nr:response regulator [Nitrospirota bacterium]